jgi:hypothetical protein
MVVVEGTYTSKSLGDDKMTDLSEKEVDDDDEDLADSSSDAEVYVPYDF